MSYRKVFSITLIGGTDVIGELERHDADNAILWRPCIVRFVPPSPANPQGLMQLQDILQSPFYTGEFIELNMRAVQWIGKPPKELADAYQRIKSPIVIANSLPASVNQ